MCSFRNTSEDGYSRGDTRGYVLLPFSSRLTPRDCWQGGIYIVHTYIHVICHKIHTIVYIHTCKHTYTCICLLIITSSVDRLATFLRKTKAAVSIQRNVRCFICRRRYQNLRKATVVLQACYRGGQARREYTKLREGAKATLIQRFARGWLARRAYRHTLRCVLLAQCCVRRWLAKRELKKLKV